MIRDPRPVMAGRPRVVESRTTCPVPRVKLIGEPPSLMESSKICPVFVEITRVGGHGGLPRLDRRPRPRAMVATFTPPASVV